MGEQATQARVAFLCGGSIFSSVTLVLLNKYIMNDYHFKFMLALTSFHFMFTGALMYSYIYMGKCEAKYLPQKQSMIVALAGKTKS